MKLCKSLLTLGLCALLVALAGCCCGGDSETTTIVEKQPIQQSSVGDQLLKLKEARDQGIINAKEYEAAKEKILEKQ